MRPAAVVVLASMLAAGCAVGPKYVRPSAPVPPVFKEAVAGQRPEDWKPAAPADVFPRGPWWEVFGDPELSALEAQVDVANQDVARAEATYRVARALARGVRAELFPTLTGGASVTLSHGASRNTGGVITGQSTTGHVTIYQIPFDLSWEADVFGRIRRGVESSVAQAQASAADLEAARLSLHAELATDWFILQGLDAQKRLLDEAIESYERALRGDGRAEQPPCGRGAAGAPHDHQRGAGQGPRRRLGGGGAARGGGRPGARARSGLSAGLSVGPSAGLEAIEPMPWKVVMSCGSRRRPRSFRSK